jgi:guanylate kinase
MEQHGVDYYFISRDEFLERSARGEFLEYAEVHGNYYGTQRDATETLISAGMDVLLDIDVQGARQLIREVTEAVTVFVLPPSRQVLEDRLRKRALNSAEDLARRLHNASEEVQHCREFQYVIVNDDLGRANMRLEAIIRAERQRPDRQVETIQTILNDFGGK